MPNLFVIIYIEDTYKRVRDTMLHGYGPYQPYPCRIRPKTGIRQKRLGYVSLWFVSFFELKKDQKEKLLGSQLNTAWDNARPRKTSHGPRPSKRTTSQLQKKKLSVFIFSILYIYSPYPRNYTFRKCRFPVSSYPYPRICIPVPCNIGETCNPVLNFSFLFRRLDKGNSLK